MATKRKIKTIDDLRAISEQADDLAMSGKKDECIVLLREGLEVAKTISEAYVLFFEAEIAGYEEGNYKRQLELMNAAAEQADKDYFILRSLGVVFSINDRKEEAIECYDKALSIKADDNKALRNKGVVLSKLGREEEAIEYYDKALSIKADDNKALRQKGVSLSELGREEEAIAYYDKALSIKADDYDALRNKGVALSKLGREEEAIEYFDKALSIKADDYDALRQKGVSLSELGREVEAIAYYDKALSIKADDYDALRQKGVSLSKLDREEEAIKYFEDALSIEPNDVHARYGKAVVLAKQGYFEDAYSLIKIVIEKEPDDLIFQSAYEYLLSVLNKRSTVSGKVESNKGLKTDKSDDSVRRGAEFEVDSLKGLVKRIQSTFKRDIEGFKQDMDETKNRIDGYIAAKSALAKERSLFFVLRKWNSYTPIVSGADGEDSVGGGYFLYHKGIGVVVDPGYDFIDNFHKAGLRVADITHIVVTHAHNDHTIDFESLLTLLYKYNSKLESDSLKKKVRIYLSPSATIKLNGLIGMKSPDYIDGIYPVSNGQRYALGDDISMCILPAYHEDTVAKDYAIGVRFELRIDNSLRHIVLTSDTSLFPTPEGSKVVNTKGMEIWKRYDLGGVKPDVLVPHIGSVRKEEFDTDIDTGYDKLFYPNHLGVMGTLQVICSVQPELAVVSEFGEELKSFRPQLMKLITQVTSERCKELGIETINVVAGDLPFVYDIKDKRVYCVLSKEFVSAKDIVSSEVRLKDGDETFTYYQKDNRAGLSGVKLRKATEEFMCSCKMQKTPYFETKS